LSRAAGGDDDDRGGESHQAFSIAAIRGETNDSIVFDNEVNGKSALEDVDGGTIANSGDQCPFDFGAGCVAAGV
jgi:hypothetical protein